MYTPSVFATPLEQHRFDMRLLLVIPLLLQSGGAWVLPIPSLRLYSQLTRSGEPQKLAVPFKHPARGKGRLTAALDGDLPTGGSATDDGDRGVNMVKARLSKPMGLVLAEKEIGMPGLVVDDMTEGGSAKVMTWAAAFTYSTMVFGACILRYISWISSNRVVWCQCLIF